MRQIVGVLPRRPATFSMAARMLRLAPASLSKVSNSRSASAASTVPAQVRKSFAVKSSPVISRRYAFTSEEVTSRWVPSGSRYWNSSCPGRSWQALTIRATRRSFSDTSQVLPLLPLKRNDRAAPSIRTWGSRRVVRP